jgi:3-oxoacyl-[acyl-carrier protein] reductase
MMGELKAVVTGGAGGLGSEIARRLRADGWHVAIADVDPKAAEESARQIDLSMDRVVPLRCDVLDTSSVDGAMASAASTDGRLDLLVNCAGIAAPGPSADIDDAHWHRMLGIHVDGTMRCCRAAFPYLCRSEAAAIINLSSMNSQLGVSGRLSYIAAKGAIEGMTRVLAVEWARFGIRVNAIAPGYIETPMLAELIRRGDHDRQRMLNRVPLGRLGRPSDIAGVVAFLASADARYITGQTIVADGGRTINGDL